MGESNKRKEEGAVNFSVGPSRDNTMDLKPHKQEI